jgi:hypothetical protein
MMGRASPADIIPTVAAIHSSGRAGAAFDPTHHSPPAASPTAGGHAGSALGPTAGWRRGRFAMRNRGRGPLRFRTATCWRPCWLSVGAHGRMATGSVRHAESGSRSIEVPYCLRRLLLCPFGTQYALVFSGRPAGRPVYAPLRKRAAPPPGDLPGTRPAPRRSAFRAPRAWLGSSAPTPRPPWRWPPSRGAAAGVYPARGPHLAAPHVGPVGPARTPGSPSSNTVAAAAFTPLRLRAAPPPGHYPARGPHLAAPHVGSVCPARIPGLPLLVHRGCGRLRPATVARGTAAGPGPGARLAARPLRFPDLGGPARNHGAFAVPLAALRARGRLGRRDAVDARL